MKDTGLGTRVSGLARLLWLGLLLLPAATSVSSWHDWDIPPLQLLAASAAWVLALRLLLPGPAFFVVSYPAALASATVLGADALRHVDALELAAQWRSFSAEDVRSALLPYRWHLLSAAAVLAGWAWLCTRGPAPPAAGRWRLRLGSVTLLVAGLAAWLPPVAWARAWPASAAVVAASLAVDQPQWAGLAVAGAGALGRPQDDWGARREPAAAALKADAETYVLIIGESLRADFLRECGGPAGIRTLAAGSLVACDVSAGANATHTSVPLLISRHLPGLRTRVPADATFQSAFAHVGFKTAWLATQGQDVAWPDAQVQQYGTGSDSEVLLPALDDLLKPPAARWSVVLHVTGAHEPYCSRFDRRQAPLGDRCAEMGEVPTPTSRDAWRAMYGNAVDASVGFVNAVIDRLERQPGPVFLVFTPDHAENLLDDRRRLHGHALRTPSLWDTRVPAVFWANAAWKAAHPQRWRQLQRNLSEPLMHADIVPTLLQAADIRVQDGRDQAINLLVRAVPARERLVQSAIGSTVRFEALREAAERAR